MLCAAAEHVPSQHQTGTPKDATLHRLQRHRADPIDMDEDEKEMLSEASHRLLTHVTTSIQVCRPILFELDGGIFVFGSQVRLSRR